jgi:hypothetical protein
VRLGDDMTVRIDTGVIHGKLDGEPRAFVGATNKREPLVLVVTRRFVRFRADRL